MADQTPATADGGNDSRNKPMVLMGVVGQTLHMWHGLEPAPEIKAVWRNEKGPVANKVGKP